MGRIRPQLTVKELVEFLEKCNPSALVSAAPSLVNYDEPKETQEFVDWERKLNIVAVERGNEHVVFGFSG
jgi:hypothetical protein